MKKIYLLAFSLCVGTGLFAQMSMKDYLNRNQQSKGNTPPMTISRVEAGQNGIELREVVLSENFDGVSGTLPVELPIGWSTTDVLKTNGTTATDDDTNGPAFMIYNSTTANAGGYWPVTEIGNGNKFAGANDDALPCNCNMESIYIETPPMDFSSVIYPAATFSIYHDGNFGGGDAFVSVSGDGGANWTQINYPLDDAGFLPIEEGNWQTIVLTLFDYIGSPDVRIRFNWSDGGEWASGFAIDNLSVGDLDEYSLAMDKVVFGDWNQADFGLGFWDYTMIPMDQASPVKATAIVSNLGFNELSEISLEVEVMNGATSVGTWDNPSLDPLGSLLKDTLSVVTDYIPTSEGEYQIMATVTSNATESDLENNSAMTHFEMTECTYGRDLDAAQAFMEMLGGEIVGNLFDVYEDQTFGSIHLALGGETVIGGAISGLIFEFGGFDDNTGEPIFTPIQNSATIEVTAFEDDINSVGENHFICLPFENPVTLAGGGVYLVAISGSATVRVPVSGSNVWVTSWTFRSDNTWSATLGIPMIRLIGQCADACTVGVQESNKDNASLEQNMPNPASDFTTINYSLNGSSNVALTVRDIAGQLVEEVQLGNKSIGNHNYRLDVSNYAPGMYSYTINAGGNNITRKMIVK